MSASAKPRVLVVIDSRPLRVFVETTLEGANYEVHSVTSGFDALRAIPRGDFELFLLAVQLPDLGAVELTQFIRQRPNHVAVPILLLASDGAVPDRDRALALGATAHLTGPFTAETLLDTVRGLVQAPNPT